MTAHCEQVMLAKVRAVDIRRFTGIVDKVFPGHVEAEGPLATLGDLCAVETQSADGSKRQTAIAEVAAVSGSRVTLIPFDETALIAPRARVVLNPARRHAPVGDGFSGRAVDALGAPIDGGPSIAAGERLPIAGAILDPLRRAPADKILETGVRAIDGLLTLGRGQRVGVFAASGVGKTTLISQLIRQIACQRCVICLVGERGREVEALWRELGASEDARRFTVVAATSDRSAALRARAVLQALCLAEYWRERGEDVLLVVDSVTRYAMALREIGLAAGAPPTMRAYTPNVFSALPRIVERAGAARSGGSISAIFTVLSETDDVDDPIVEVMKALLDGHIVLSRTLAEEGHFPPIDILRSVSRQAEGLVAKDHAAAARSVIANLAAYAEARLMIDSGLYKAGSNERIDAAVALRPALLAFLRQGQREREAAPLTLTRLKGLGARRMGHG